MNEASSRLGTLPIGVAAIRAVADTAATTALAIANCPMLICRPVRARRAARMSRRGSQRWAIRSIFGVALCRRANERAAAAAAIGTPLARSRIVPRRRFRRRRPTASLNPAATRAKHNATATADKATRPYALSSANVIA